MNECNLRKHQPKIDALDAKMIELLQKDGRIPNTTIAKKLGIAESTVRTRLKGLIDDKIVKIVAVSSPYDLGFQVAVNFKINIDIRKKDLVMKELIAIKELWYVVLQTGGTDVDADFIVPTFEDLETLIFCCFLTIRLLTTWLNVRILHPCRPLMADPVIDRWRIRGLA